MEYFRDEGHNFERHPSLSICLYSVSEIQSKEIVDAINWSTADVIY